MKKVFQVDGVRSAYDRGMETQERIRGKVGGAAILTLFGALWCIVALVNWHGRPGWSIPAGSAATIALLGLCGVRLMTSRKITRFDDPAEAAEGERTGRLFGIIFGVEGGLIGLSAGLLGSHGLGVWIPVVAAVIVGVHFIPLARLFHVPLYYWTGVLSVLGVFCCLLVPDIGMRLLCVGLMMSAVLWLTVVALLVQTRSMLVVRA